ncbi:MAG: 16S rRNA (adenine(1518)-N(6)/adenine(1519)-N(6))-dimethyltransferase RsmA [Steroidobacteraceae bacterium]
MSGAKHVPRKRFGQHFLHDRDIIARIVDAIDPKPGDRLVEIGPGLGALTWPLLARHGTLDVIEIDRDAIATLEATPRTAGELRIHGGDVLQFDFATLRGQDPRRLRIVGNLPYNISTPLLFKLIEVREHIEDMHFMLQKEVVDRMAAGAGDDAYGRLSVMLAPWVEVQPLFDIGPGAFKPPPKVMSTYVRLLPRAQPAFALGEPARFAAIVAAAFGQRRKTLRNSLKALVGEAGFVQAGIDPGLRAEVLSPAQFAALANTAGVSG